MPLHCHQMFKFCCISFACFSADRVGDFYALIEGKTRHQILLSLHQQTKPPQQTTSHQWSLAGTLIQFDFVQ